MGRRRIVAFYGAFLAHILLLNFSGLIVLISASDVTKLDRRMWQESR
jgi:hypothetical protein